MVSVLGSKSAGSHSSSSPAKKQPIKTIITRLRSLSVASPGRSPPSAAASLQTKTVKQQAVAALAHTSTTPPTSSTPLRNNDDILRNMFGGKQSNVSSGITESSTGSFSFFFFGSPLTEYFDFQFVATSATASSPNNSICSSKDNSSQTSDCLPGFLNTKCIVYQGFGGWISKKQLRPHLFEHTGKPQIFIIKTFKHNSQLKAGGIDKYRADCVKEFQIMNRLKNRNITPVYNLCKDEDASSDTVYYSIILPFYTNGDLFAILSNLERTRKKNNSNDESKRNKSLISTKLVNYFFKQMIAGVCYLHANHVVHCDLKLDNFLIDDNFNLKITDFGMAVMINDHGKPDIDSLNDDDSDTSSLSNLFLSKKSKDIEESKKLKCKFSACPRKKRIRVYKNIDLCKIGTKSYKAPELFFSEKQEQILDKFYSSSEKCETDDDDNDDDVKFLDSIFENLKSLDSWSLGICYLILNLQMFKPWEFSSVWKDVNFRIFKKFYTAADKSVLKALKSEFSKGNYGSSKESGGGLESLLNLEISNFVNDNKITEDVRSDEEKFEEFEIRNSISFIKLIPDQLKYTIWRLLNVRNSDRLLPEDILVNKTEDGSPRAKQDKEGVSNTGGSAGFMWVHDVEYFSSSEIEKMLCL